MSLVSEKTIRKNNKMEYILLAQVVSCIGVIFLHTNGCFWNFSTERYWFTANIIESFWYFPVPVFFMVTGITLMDYQERYSTAKYMVKRLKKSLIPFLAWSLIGVVYMIILGRVSLSELTILGVWNSIWSAEYVNIFWFFPKLFRVYLCMPLLAALSKEKRKPIFTYVVVITFFIYYVPALIINILGITISWPVTLDVTDGYLMFPIVGYLIHKYPPSKRWRIFIYAMGILSFFVHCVGTYVVSMSYGYISKMFKGYLSVIGLSYGIAFLVFFQQFGDTIMRVRWINKIIKFLSSYQMPLYLMQWFIMDMAIKAFNIDTRSIIYRLGFPFVLIAIVIAVAWTIRKIPILKEIVP